MMWKNMRNALAAALILVMVSAVCLAAGTHEPWTCPQCGKTDNTGNYCGDCGHPAPWLEKEIANDPEIRAGDGNGDGYVNIIDILLLQKYLSRWNVSVDIGAYDLNGDGTVGVEDMLILQRQILNWN